MRKLAPIGISVYTRINHFKQCIEALQKNILAEKSGLFVYSDAASKKEDEDLVKEVREFAHSIKVFKKLNVIEREKNYGGTRNAFFAFKEITEKFKKSIFLEDEIVTASGFLTFMNEALEFYKDDDRILSITGYSPPLNLPNEYDNDIFILPRYNGWGTGVWKSLMSEPLNKIDKKEFIKIKNKKKVFTVGGEDVLSMIEAEINEELNAGDVRVMYYQALNDKYTLYPKKSLTQNIGHDGSGVHCGKNNKFNVKLWDKVDNFEFIKDIQPDERIIKANKKFRRIGVRGKIVKLTKQIRLYSYLKKIHDSVQNNISL
jgi:hypothetical protein